MFDREIDSAGIIPPAYFSFRTIIKDITSKDLKNSPMHPPLHPKKTVHIEKFGIERTDPYAWMKPANWHEVLRSPLCLSKEIKQVIDKENAYSKAVMSCSETLTNDISSELQELERKTCLEQGFVRSNFYYFQTKGNSGDVTYRRRNISSGQEDVLLDMATHTNPGAKLSWGGPVYSPDFSLFGWAIDQSGSGDFHINVLDIESNTLVVSELQNNHGNFAFDKSARYLFWVGKDEKGRPNAVWRRDISAGTDTKCFENADTAFFIDLNTSKSGDFIFIRLLNGDQSEVWFISSQQPCSAPQLVQPMSAFHDYSVEHWQDKFVIRSNHDGADDYKIVTAPIHSPGIENWEVLIPHSSGQYIVELIPFEHHLVRVEWRDAKPCLIILDNQYTETSVAFSDDAYALQVIPQQDYFSDAISYVYSSLASPQKLVKTHFDKGDVSAVLNHDSEQAFDSTNFCLKRLNITADDGAKIPLTLLTKTGCPPNPNQPVYMLAYGAYGEITEASFRAEAIALAERGWTFAIAHVRGGGERGSSWWRPTLKRGKKLTFSDFTNCAEQLIEMDMASKGNIVAHGMSAGGLLMGSVFASHPHLWAGVIAQVPFVDVLNTLDDWENHPLGSTPFAIWGDPRNEEDYQYIASYSPYDSLKPANYPALLTTGGVADERVAFWEPLKFAAKARDLNKNNTPILSKIGLQTGHFGDTSPQGQLDQMVLFLCFAINSVKGHWVAPESALESE